MHFELLPYPLARRLFSLGYDHPTQIQSLTYTPFVNKQSFMAQAPTGSGKTAAFSIGLYLNVNVNSPKLQAILISPTRELCEQTYGQLKLITGLSVECCASAEDFKKTRQQLQNNKVQILVGTLQKIKSLGREIDLSHVTYIIADEADEMASKPDFIEYISQCKKSLALFSATFSDQSIQNIKEAVELDAEIFAEPEQRTQNAIVQHFCLECEHKDDKLDYLSKIFEKLLFVQCVVFVNSQTQVDSICSSSQMKKYSVLGLHSGLQLHDRINNLKKFKSGASRILITTDVFGRGMDVRSVTLVVNFDLPREMEQFVHRSGRCGRFGRQGTVVSFQDNKNNTVQKWAQQLNIEVGVI
ncbi:Eukaryotic_translation initiation factor 4A [Hexamita inflata]|uniref:ATP-dependent RNA helicase n=1 Tax=Hexamita inflata TaxID=28002 RepID=A0AA86N7G3_9EUKA|nr:Eukaryotic translation initiation factor 4A [Hexamita inflata]